MGKKKQMGRGVRIQYRWKKSATASGKVGASRWRLGTKDNLSSVQDTHFSVPASHFNSTNGCGNYSHVESQFSHYHWIHLYLSLIFMSWPMCQVYFRSQRKDSVPSHKHGWGGFLLLGPSSLLFPQPHPPGKHCPCTAGKDDCWGPRHHYGPAGQGTALKIEH